MVWSNKSMYLLMVARRGCVIIGALYGSIGKREPR